MRNSNRQKVIANRRRLKGTGIGVHEVLTQASQYIYDATRDMAKSVSKVQSVWTWQGVTHVLVDDGDTAIKCRVHSLKDIQDIAKKYADSEHADVKDNQGITEQNTPKPLQNHADSG